MEFKDGLIIIILTGRPKLFKNCINLSTVEEVKFTTIQGPLISEANVMQYVLLTLISAN